MENVHLIWMLKMEVTQVLFFPLKGVFIDVRNLIFLTQVIPDFPLYRPFHRKVF